MCWNTQDAVLSSMSASLEAANAAADGAEDSVSRSTSPAADATGKQLSGLSVHDRSNSYVQDSGTASHRSKTPGGMPRLAHSSHLSQNCFLFSTYSIKEASKRQGTIRMIGA